MSSRRIDGKTFQRLYLNPKSKRDLQAVASNMRRMGYNARIKPVKNGWNIFYRAKPGVRALRFDAPQYRDAWRE